MFNTKRRIIASITSLAVFYILFVWFIQDMEWLHRFATIVSIFIYLIGLKWLYRAIVITQGKKRHFWLMIGVGLSLYCLANASWIYLFIVYQVTTYPFVSLFLLVMAYFVFLASLVYKIKTIEMKEPVQAFSFSISVFMTFIVVIHMHYFIQPIMSLVNGSIGMTVLILGFQISTISIFFAASLLFYVSRKSAEKDPILFLITGMFFHASGVFLYYCFLVNNIDSVIADVVWLLGLLFIVSSLKLVEAPTEISEWKMIKYFENRESRFPYIIVFILLIMIIESHDWELNALIIGMTIMLLMISGRQWYVMRHHRKLVKEYRYLAFHDTLTGLKNRTKFTKDLETMMQKSEKEQQPFLMFLMDLDQFKSINDTLGHNVGDMLLEAASKRLKKAFEQVGKVYRIGGDEFVIIVPGLKRIYGTLYAKTVLDLFSTPFLIKNHTIMVTPSIGISVYPEDGQKQETLIHHADAAMYLAKEKGKAQYCYFNQQLYQTILRKKNIELELQQAIELNQFSLYFQPKINLKSEEIIGVEAFIRWNHPRLGVISPYEFIPVAEETGYIFAIDEWVITHACEQLRLWHQKGYENLTISINVSAKQLEQKDFNTRLKQILNQIALDPQYLELEIKESTMGNIVQTIDTLNELHAIGVRIAIDDFGTGYSSLHILQSLPFDTIKIDQSFVTQLEKKENVSVIKTIIDIGSNLNMKVVAEGVETAYQARTLANLKCKYGQGYFFSKPLSAEQLHQFLEQ
ncbi:Phytochrome-like protein cph2 [Paraliobacillus sp. PM-2]|uniref:putative bifunctional diguanylate cyclase/phosphodiesterase n=1 Tax=Paraliobacillus sp. PM-2 TaxID=1462524 RepID=UPI00061BDBF6|nr:EAL domain-containing protein [Paraliobacillus sp. PM-2]CQR46338.1 Phytochrome-like protein cph2 [Paraliobacillus sp. PM-2]